MNNEANKETTQKTPLQQEYDILARVLEEDAAGGKPMGVPTGLYALDRVLYGWQPGTLTYIAGRPGTGKSSFALATAQAATFAGKKVCYISLEMSNEILIKRMTAARTGIPLKALMESRLTQDQRTRIQHELDKIQDRQEAGWT